MMRYLLGLTIIISAFCARAQNDPLFSHYFFNPMYLHPGWAAVETESYVSAIARSQWTGYQSSFDGSGGAPNTQMFNAFFAVKGPINGFGATIINDNLGPLNNVYANFPVARKFDIGYSSITVGVMPGFVSQTANFDELRFVNPDDPLNVGSRLTEVGFNLGAGLVYQSRSSMFIALSVNNIVEPGFDYGLDSFNFDNNLNRSYSLLGGFSLPITRDFKLTPNAQIRSDLNTFTFDVGGVVNYKERGWAGLSYRWGEAASILIGYSFLENNALRVGYAFDYVTNEREAKQTTSQEFFVRYALPDIIFGGRKQIKTPRFAY